MTNFSRWRLSSLAVFVASVIAIGACGLSRNDSPAASASDRVYERVARNKLLRVGYVNVSPTCLRDPNTRKMSGMFRRSSRKGRGVIWV